MYIPPQKDAYIALFVNSFRIMHLLQLLMVSVTSTTLILSKLMKTQKHTNAMLTYLTRKRGYSLSSKLEEQIKAEQQYWSNVMEKSASCNLCACFLEGTRNVLALTLWKFRIRNPSYLSKRIYKEMI